MELASSRDILEQRTNRWLTRSQNGALDGRAPSPEVSPSSPSFISTGTVSPYVISVVSDGAYAPEAGDTTSGKPVEQRGFVYRAEWNVNAAGVDGTSWNININGVAAFSFTMDASTASGFYDLLLADVEMVEVGDIVQGECTDGGGHEGITIDVMISPVLTTA
jgi:hypothetical protein